MEFTKDELYEIEKIFDIHAGQTAHGLASIVDKLKCMGEKNKLSQKLFNETCEQYDVFRTISAKAHKLRGEKK